MRVNLIRVLGAMTTIGSQMGMEIIIALEDGELDAKEVGRIVKRGINGLRMAGVSQKELDQVLLIVDKYEFDMLDFKEGDMLIYSPAEVNAKLKVKL